MDSKTILVIGATGYVGGRLIPRLLESGYRVRAVGRSLTKLKDRPWAQDSKVELAKGEVLDPESLKSAVKGCSAAFYLVHGMNSYEDNFAEADRRAARNMAEAAAEADLERILYLGGMGRVGDGQLPNLMGSGIEVADILQSGPVPVTFLRAAMILGSGSAS